MDKEFFDSLKEKYNKSNKRACNKYMSALDFIAILIIIFGIYGIFDVTKYVTNKISNLNKQHKTVVVAKEKPKIVIIKKAVPFKEIKKNWVLVSDEKDKYYIDLNSVLVNGNIREVWIKQIENNKTTKFYTVYNCDNKMYVDIVSGETDRLYRKEDIKKDISNWSSVENSEGDIAVYNRVCKIK